MSDDAPPAPADEVSAASVSADRASADSVSADSVSTDDPAATKAREVRFRHSPNLAELLERAGLSLLVSTYQAGKLVAVGGRGGELFMEFSNFDRPMGLALRPDGLAVGTRDAIWTLRGDREIARRLDPPGSYDIGLFARGCHHTGEIQCHEMAFDASAPDGGELWVVNTAFSCLCTLDPRYSFVPRWRPPFISDWAAGDRCHLNGLAAERGVPKFVTALGETDTPGGWRPGKVGGGVLIDVASGQTVARGFAMPHSPRLHGGRAYLLDSGNGRLVTVDLATGTATPVAEVPGYARGLSIADTPGGPLAFVGLSKIRETAVFGGMPIAERRADLLCGVGVIELATGRTLATLQFETGVEEVFDVLVLPGVRRPAVRGPHAAADGYAPAWIVPPAR